MKIALVTLFLFGLASVLVAFPEPEEETSIGEPTVIDDEDGQEELDFPEDGEDDLDELDFPEDEDEEGEDNSEEEGSGEEEEETEVGEPVTVDRKRRALHRWVRAVAPGFDVDSDQGAAGGCTPEWKENPKSTMCVYKDSPDATDLGITAEDKKLILEEHNEYRKNANGANIVRIYWDGKLAELAQKMAQTCTRKHDTNKNRDIPGYNINVGQNIGSGHKTWAGCIANWHSEKKDFKYGKATTSMIGHYTQVVMHDAVAIGCGFAACPGKFRPVHVRYCNYAYGQTTSEQKFPYKVKKGGSCAICPNTCKNGLCDCGKKICFNLGLLQADTCKCKCAKPYAGSDCLQVKCPKKDHYICGKKVYVNANCDKYSTLRKKCPYECGICKK